VITAVTGGVTVTHTNLAGTLVLDGATGGETTMTLAAL